jgi:hypothetical protein
MGSGTFSSHNDARQVIVVLTASPWSGGRHNPVSPFSSPLRRPGMDFQRRALKRVRPHCGILLLTGSKTFPVGRPTRTGPGPDLGRKSSLFRVRCTEGFNSVTFGEIASFSRRSGASTLPALVFSLSRSAGAGFRSAWRFHRRRSPIGPGWLRSGGGRYSPGCVCEARLGAGSLPPCLLGLNS